MSAEEKARQSEAEEQLWEQMAIETEQKLAQQITNQRVTPQQTADILQRSQVAAQNIDLDEDQTRQIIDQKLREKTGDYVQYLEIMDLVQKELKSTAYLSESDKKKRVLKYNGYLEQSFL